MEEIKNKVKTITIDDIRKLKSKGKYIEAQALLESFRLVGKKNMQAGRRNTHCIESRKRSFVLKRHNLCRVCTKPILSGQTLCKNCAIKKNLSAKKLRDKAKSMGICVKCQIKKATIGVYCPVCYSSQYNFNLKRRKNLIEHGLCYVCGKPSNTSICLDCRKKKSKYDKIYRKVVKSKLEVESIKSD